MEEGVNRELKPEEAEAFARFQDELRRMTVGEHLAAMMQSLAALAVRKMGATSDSAAEKDLDQAKQAVEAFRVLLPVLETSRPEDEMRAHRHVLSQLQMAYVAAIGQETRGTSDVPEGSDAPDELEQTEQVDPSPDPGETSGSAK